MATYVAFLRGINLGATRKFGKDDVRAATEAAGGAQVETYLNTGNVRLTSARRSAAAVQKALELAYAADRGFEVPTVVFTPPEIAQIASRATQLARESGHKGKHYITLYAVAPPAAAVAVVEGLDLPGERAVVAGRAAYVLLDGNIHDSRLLRSKEFAALGQGTARTQAVLETVAARWAS